MPVPAFNAFLISTLETLAYVISPDELSYVKLPYPSVPVTFELVALIDPLIVPSVAEANVFTILPLASIKIPEPAINAFLISTLDTLV